MMHTNKKLKILVLVFMIVSVSFFSVPKKTEAVWPVIDKFKIIVDKIFHGISIASNALTNAALGLPGSSQLSNNTSLAADGTCEAGKQVLDIAETADTFGGAELIGGSAGRVAKINAKIGALTVLKKCKEINLKVEQLKLSQPGVQGISVTAAHMSKLAVEISSLENRLTSLKVQRDEALKEMWKAVATRILINVQQEMSTRMVNNLMEKYKISNVTEYADALASQVYAIDYANKYLTDSRDQAIVRSILENPKTQGTVLPMVRMKTQDALGFDPEELNFYDENYYQKMAIVGSRQTNPYLGQVLAEEQAEMLKLQSQAQANSEIDNGNGMISIRSGCADVAVQQNEFDLKNKQLSQKVREREKALSLLQSQSMLNNGSVAQEEIIKAKFEIREAQNELDALPKSSKAFKQVCGSIVNPASMVANFTNSYLASNLNSAANFRNENMPFFARFAETFATNFINKIIQGNITSFKQVKETGIEDSNVSSSVVIGNQPSSQVLRDADALSQGQTLVFSGQRTQNSQPEYSLDWNASAVSGASYITLIGPSVNIRSSTLAGSQKVISQAGGAYVIRVYNSANQLLTTATFLAPVTVNPPIVSDSGNTTEQALNAAEQLGNQVDTGPDVVINPEDVIYDTGPPGVTSGLDQVQGAFIKKSPVKIRER